MKDRGFFVSGWIWMNIDMMQWMCLCLNQLLISWVTWKLRCVPIRILVSSCRCWVFVSICAANSDAQSCVMMLVFTYFKMGRVVASNVETITTFGLPFLMEVSAFRNLSVRFALVIITFMCCILCYHWVKSDSKNFGVFCALAGSGVKSGCSLGEWLAHLFLNNR